MGTDDDAAELLALALARSRHCHPPWPDRTSLPCAERKDIDAITSSPLGASAPMLWAQSLGANDRGINIGPKAEMVIAGFGSYPGLPTTSSTRRPDAITALLTR